MTIEKQMLLLKESFDSVGTKLNGLTWQRIEKSHLDFAQSQTQELQEQNAELVEMLSLVCMDLEERGRAYGDAYTMSKEILTKYNHLNSNTNETDKI